MEHTRVRDLGITLLADGGFLVRAPGRGIAARVPLHAVELLSWCSEPRTEAAAEARFGPTGRRLYGALVDVGLLVEPGAASDTPVMFENFASLDVHRRMLSDAPRMEAYRRAIHAVVRPGMAVLDAGTGSGVLAGLAARAGARVVYAVDNSDMIEVAAEVFRASGLSERVHAIRADVADTRLPEPVDLILTETFGALALAEGAFDDISAARQRHLAPGGTVLPSGLTLHLAPVGDPRLLDEAIGPFAPWEGVNLGVLRSSAFCRAMTTPITPAQLLHPGAPFATLPFPTAPRASGHAAFTSLPRTPVVGFAAWFTLHLAPGVDLPTGPADPATHWKQQFLPVPPFLPDEELRVAVEVGPALSDRRGIELRLRWVAEGRETQTFHRQR